MLIQPDVSQLNQAATEAGRVRDGLLPSVKKIAVLRANAIGDYIFSLPALAALRAAYPGAEIVLLGQEWHAGFLTDRPGPVDRVVVVPRIPGIWDPPEGEAENPYLMEAFFEEMQAEGFDLAIQMHGGGRNSNPFLNRLGARITAGLRTPDALMLDLWVPYVFYQPEIFRYLEVVGLVGAAPVTLAPQLQVTEQDREEADQILLPGDMPLAILNPGSGSPRRRWPPEKFAAVGNALAWAGAEVAVIGVQDEAGLAQAVVNGMAAPVHNLSGKTSLEGLTGLLSRAAVVVSNDSGPLHLASAVGAATVGIYWCGNLIVAGPVSRSNHRPAISWQLDCPVCGLDCTQNECGHQVSFVAGVSQEEVIASALSLLELSQVQHPVLH